MKKETIEKGTILIDRISKIDIIIEKISMDKNCDDTEFLSSIKITKGSEYNKDRSHEINFTGKGELSSDTNLTPESMIILEYTVIQFHASILKLYQAEKIKLEKEFENLKD